MVEGGEWRVEGERWECEVGNEEKGMKNGGGWSAEGGEWRVGRKRGD